MKRVYIVIVNWNGWKDTLECLAGIFCNNYPDYRVIIVDNGSRDCSIERIAAWADGIAAVASENTLPDGVVPAENPVPYVIYDRDAAERGGCVDADVPLVLIRSDANLGFAGGSNIGLRYALARGDCAFAWLLNNDTVIDPDALVNMVTAISSDRHAGMCGSTLLHYDSPDRVQAYGGGYYCKWIGLPWVLGRLKTAGDHVDVKRVIRWSNYVVGASLLVSADFLRDVGLLCEDYFLYFEETDWALRAEGRYGITYASDSIVYHKVGSSIGTSTNPAAKSAICDYFNVRNRLFFTHRFFPYALPTIYLTLLAAVLVRLLVGKWDRAAMILRTMWTYRQIDRRFIPSSSVVNNG